MFKVLLFPFKIVFKILGWIFGVLFGFVPPLKSNMSGEAFESYMQLLLKRLGYKKVELTNKNDYGIDILAYKKKQRYGFQCKYYSKPVGVSAIQQVVGASAYYNCDCLVVVTNNTFTKQAITLATSNLVELWDGSTLNKLRLKANAKGLFRRKEKETLFTHPYLSLLEQLLQDPLVNVETVQKYCSITDERADYLLEDLEFLDLVSEADGYGMRERCYNTLQEAIDILKRQQ